MLVGEMMGCSFAKSAAARIGYWSSGGSDRHVAGRESLCADVGLIAPAHGYAASFSHGGVVMSLVAARAMSPSRRHFGIEFADFQLETVVGARSKACATATVPPSAVMKSSTVCMVRTLRQP